MKSKILNTIKYLVLIGIITTVLLFAINALVVFSSKKQIVNSDADFSSKKDCILVLGAGVWNGRPSHMLADRLDVAIELYKKGASDKIIMSGDHGRENYDEVNIMKAYAIEKGVPSSDIFMDHAGFSTYDSIYRTKAVFEADDIIIVTQKYHLFRAVHIAKVLDIQVSGVPSDARRYTGATYREAREVLARNKDFIKCLFRPKPTYLGDTISVFGNGNVTNDENSKNYFETGK